VKPKFWWRKKFYSHEADLLKQQIEMNGTSLLGESLVANASTTMRQTTTSIFARHLSDVGNAYKQVIGLGHVLEKSTMGEPIQFVTCLVHSSIHAREAVSSPRATDSSNLTPVLFKRGRRCNLGKHPPLLLSSEGSPTSKLFKELRSWKLATPETKGHGLQELSVLSRRPD
jgi:hypothetical protein